MRKLASIVEISAVCPIEDADRLEVAEMKGKGWRVVTAKGEFKPGEAEVFCKENRIEYVNVVERNVDVFNRFATVDEILAYAEGKTIRGNEREGLVFKSVDHPYVSFKAVSNRYLLKQA